MTELCVNFIKYVKFILAASNQPRKIGSINDIDPANGIYGSIDQSNAHYKQQQQQQQQQHHQHSLQQQAARHHQQQHQQQYSSQQAQQVQQAKPPVTSISSKLVRLITQIIIL